MRARARPRPKPLEPLPETLLARLAECRDPIKFGRLLWPRSRFYDRQEEIVRSVYWNTKTVVPAGNKLGKDYVAGFLAVGAFLAPHIFLGTRGDPRCQEVRVVTTSVRDDHLDVLWGEIGRYIATSAVPLLREKGGPLVQIHHEVTKYVHGHYCEISYLKGITSKKGEGMAGHHANHTLFIADEASGIDDQAYEQADGWAKRHLIIGNPNPCNNAFYRYVREGDLLAR